MVSSVAVVGDVHFDKGVVSRVDDYCQTCINKLEEIFSRADVVIFLGDFFNRPIIPYKYLIRLYRCLLKAKENGLRLATIVGNHDVPNDMEGRLEETALGWFAELGLLDVITSEKFFEVTMDSGHLLRFFALKLIFEEAKKQLYSSQFMAENSMVKNIILSHNYFECAYDGFTVSDFDNCYADYVFFGHEHSPLMNPVVGKIGTKLFRSGSLMRNSANDYNLTRVPFYYIIQSNAVGVFVNKQEVYCAQDSKEVFKKESYEQSNLKLKYFTDSIHKVTKANLDAVVDLYHKNADDAVANMTVRDALEQLNTPVSAVKAIKEKYELLGEKF